MASPPPLFFARAGVVSSPWPSRSMPGTGGGANMRGLLYFPLTAAFIVAFLFFVGLLFFLVQIGLIGYAYERLGISAHLIFPLLAMSVLGSSINIPLKTISRPPTAVARVVKFFCVRYVI